MTASPEPRRRRQAIPPEVIEEVRRRYVDEPNVTLAAIAVDAGVHRRTVGNWCTDLPSRKRRPRPAPVVVAEVRRRYVHDLDVTVAEIAADAGVAAHIVTDWCRDLSRTPFRPRRASPELVGEVRRRYINEPHTPLLVIAADADVSMTSVSRWCRDLPPRQPARPRAAPHVRDAARRRYLDEPDTTVAEIAADAGVSTSAVTKWCRDLPKRSRPAASETVAEARRRYVDEPDTTLVEIAAGAGVTTRAVTGWCSDLPPRSTRTSSETRAEAQRLYLERPELSIVQIAAKVGVSRGSVSRWCVMLPRRIALSDIAQAEQNRVRGEVRGRYIDEPEVPLDAIAADAGIGLPKLRMWCSDLPDRSSGPARAVTAA